MLHLPYTAWHLSYVVIGGCLHPQSPGEGWEPRLQRSPWLWGSGRTPWTSCGRPLRTRIPDAVLVGLAVVSIGAACAIGVVGALMLRPWLLALVPIGLFMVVAAYNLELFGGRFHRSPLVRARLGRLPTARRIRSGRG